MKVMVFIFLVLGTASPDISFAYSLLNLEGGFGPGGGGSGGHGSRQRGHEHAQPQNNLPSGSYTCVAVSPGKNFKGKREISFEKPGSGRQVYIDGEPGYTPLSQSNRIPFLITWAGSQYLCNK